MRCQPLWNLHSMGCWGQCAGGVGCSIWNIEGGAKAAPRFLDCGEHGRGDLETEDRLKLKHFGVWSVYEPSRLRNPVRYAELA